LSDGPAFPAADDDDRLLALVAAEDSAAFAILVRRHTPRVHALALRMTASPADAEEIAQEAFWRVWTGARKWRPGGPRFTTWLYRIVVNLCIDRERRRRIRRLVQLDPELEPADQAVSAEARASDRSDLALVMEGIGRLPERQRAAILLSAEGEQSNKDIAAALGTTEKSVESMLVRARRTLRAALAAGGGDAER
jgi:RNA polymerase sigma-70 factor, ECF subfamily